MLKPFLHKFATAAGTNATLFSPPNDSFGTPIVKLEYGVPTMAVSAAFASLRLCRLVLKALFMDRVGPRDVGNPAHLHPVDGSGTAKPDRPNLTKVAIQKTWQTLGKLKKSF
jgi:hypothetical protein